MINAPMDDLKETHARLTLAPEADIPAHFAGELSRRRHNDGSVSLVIERIPGEQWPVIGPSAGSTLERLSLEDLFVEVIQ